MPMQTDTMPPAAGLQPYVPQYGMPPGPVAGEMPRGDTGPIDMPPSGYVGLGSYPEVYPDPMTGRPTDFVSRRRPEPSGMRGRAFDDVGDPRMSGGLAPRGTGPPGKNVRFDRKGEFFLLLSDLSCLYPTPRAPFFRFKSCF